MGRSYHRALPIDKARPIADAAQCFSRELAHLLFDVAILRLKEEVGPDFGFRLFFGSRSHEELRQDAEGLHDLAETLDEVGLLNELRPEIDRTLSNQGSLTDAGTMFDATVELLEEAGGALWYSLFVQERRFGNVDAQTWEAYAEAQTSNRDRARGLARAAEMWARSGSIRRAIELDQIAERQLWQDPVFCYRSLQHALHAESDSRSRHVARMLANCPAGLPDTQILLDLVRQDRAWWRWRESAHPGLMQGVTGLLPAEIAAAIQEVER